MIRPSDILVVETFADVSTAPVYWRTNDALCSSCILDEALVPRSTMAVDAFVLGIAQSQ